MNKRMFCDNRLIIKAAYFVSLFIIFFYVPVYGSEQVDMCAENYNYPSNISDCPKSIMPDESIVTTIFPKSAQVYFFSSETECSEIQTSELISLDRYAQSNSNNELISISTAEDKAPISADEGFVEENLSVPMECLIEADLENDHDSNDATCDLEPIEQGNSYIAVVIPENGVMIGAGDTAKLVATITEVGNTTKTGSAQFFIPGLLSVDQSVAVEITDGWACQWDQAAEGSGFSAILSLWALLNNQYLAKDQSVSVSFIVTAVAGQEYQFATKAWQDALIVDGIGIGTGKSNNMMAAGYSDPKINVTVNNAAELDGVRGNLNWHFVQTGDIDLSGYGSGSGWLPIGTVSNPFRGVYNGNGFVIDNLTIARPAEDNIALLGSIAKSALISTVTLKSVNLTGRKFVGSLVGSNYGGSIMNCSAAGMVNAKGSYAGGLVGYGNGGMLVSSSADVSVTGTSLVGGLVGQNYKGGLVSNTGASGSVVGSGQDIGGLVGRNRSIIESSFAISTVSASSNGEVRAGGLVGDNDGGIVRDSYARSSVAAGSGTNVGGLIGHHANGSVIRSFAEAEVWGGNLVGGLVGYNSSNGLISNSYATGAVFGANGVGGLVGLNDHSIVNSYCTGLVSGSQFVGGLAGKNNGGTINTSFYLSGHGQNLLGTPVTSDQLKMLVVFTNAGWSIVNINEGDSTLPETVVWYINENAEYPILRWQHVVEPEDPEDPADPDDQDEPGESGEDDDPGFDSDRGVPDKRFKGWNGHFSYFDLSSLLLQQQAAVNSALVRPLIFRTPGSPADEPLITVDLILSGNYDDYLWALNIYQNTACDFNLYREKISEKESIICLADLLTAQAAILAFKARLTGEVNALQKAVEAYRMIEHYLTENSLYLFEHQLTAINLVLAAVGSLLESLGQAL